MSHYENITKQIRQFWLDESEECNSIQFLKDKGWGDVQFFNYCHYGIRKTK